ncbi:hypothetical protein ECDEC4B_1635 [Escherichia coli DEC4B]|nr:hypothetical protein ECDEC4B_1635 [Escherichia coli DEC4B]
MTIRLSDNPAAAPSVINFSGDVWRHLFAHELMSALFKVNFVMQ